MFKAGIMLLTVLILAARVPNKFPVNEKERIEWQLA